MYKNLKALQFSIYYRRSLHRRCYYPRRESVQNFCNVLFYRLDSDHLQQENVLDISNCNSCEQFLSGTCMLLNLLNDNLQTNLLQYIRL